MQVRLYPPGASTGSPASTAFGQDDTGASQRKIVERKTTIYPEMARAMNISGTVRLEAVVGSNGSVKSIDVKGGNPVFAQGRKNSVRSWKWEKSSHETTEIVDIRFVP